MHAKKLRKVIQNSSLINLQQLVNTNARFTKTHFDSTVAKGC